MKKSGNAPEYPEDLYNLMKKAVAIRKHLERNSNKGVTKEVDLLNVFQAVVHISSMFREILLKIEKSRYYEDLNRLSQTGGRPPKNPA